MGMMSFTENPLREFLQYNDCGLQVNQFELQSRY